MNKLLLQSGNDIPFVGGRFSIRQPKIKEIAYLGEQVFYLGANYLSFSKDRLKEQDKNNLKNKTNFDVLMSIMNNKIDKAVQPNIIAIEYVLSLLFPDYDLMKMPNMLVFTRVVDGKKEQHLINNDNFEQFKSIVEDMFCLKKLLGGGGYNPANKLAQQIAKKLEARHKKLQKKDGDKKGVDILSRYISILVLGNYHTYSELMEYTVYQLFSEFQIFLKKYQYQLWVKSKLAGAQNLEDVDNWLNDQEESVDSPRLNGNNRIEY